MQSKTNTAEVLLPSRGSIVKFQWQDYVVYLFFLLVLVFFGLTIGGKGFLTIENLFNITRSTSNAVCARSFRVVARFRRLASSVSHHPVPMHRMWQRSARD